MIHCVLLNDSLLTKLPEQVGPRPGRFYDGWITSLVTVTCLYSAERVAFASTALVAELGVRLQFGVARPTRQSRH
jgi:hypothetical protein